MGKSLSHSIVALVSLWTCAAHATPSTVYWTPATISTQAFLVPHVTCDTYFAQAGMYPIDTGLTMGVLPFEAVSGEVGFDVFLPARGMAALLLNAKVTLNEGVLGKWAPGLSVGIMGVGFEKNVSNYNLLHAEVGKALPFGTIAVGGYYGLNEKLLVDEVGKKEQLGLIASYTSPDITIGLPGMQKLSLVTDVQTGRSIFGAFGGGVAIYFTSAVALLTGPVFFFNRQVQPGQAAWMWSTQVDIDIQILRKPRS